LSEARQTREQLYKDILGGIATATVLALAALYLPFIGFFLVIFIPLPVLYYHAKYGRVVSILILLTAVFIVSSVLGEGMIKGFFLLLSLGFVGLFLSETLRRRLSIEKTVFYPSFAVFCFAFGTFSLYNLLSGTPPWVAVSDYLYHNLKIAIGIYRKMGISQEEIDILAHSLDNVVYILVRITPGLVFVATIFISWSNLLMARSLFRTNRFFYPNFGDLNRWEAPEWLVWVAIGSGFFLLLPTSFFRFLGLNGLIIIMLVYFFQGIAILAFYFEKKRFPKLVRTIVYSFIALQQFLLIIVIMVGFFDLWIDFRRMKKSHGG